jgi:hypothetical protein
VGERDIDKIAERKERPKNIPADEVDTTLVLGYGPMTWANGYSFK